MIGLICLKEAMLVVDMSVLFVNTGTFLKYILDFSQKYAMVVSN